MAISYVGGTSANSTTTALPGTAAAGDLAIVVAGRSNAGGPGIPGDWNDLGVISGGSGGSAHGQRVGWKILTAGDITAGNVGTWSNAAAIQVLVYRGASAVGDNSGTGANSNTITFPARSSLTSGAWVVGVASHRSASDVGDAVATDYTNRSGAFTSTAVGGMDTNGAVSSVVQRTDGVNASSGNVGRTIEVEPTVAITGSGGASFASASGGTGKETFASSGGAAFEAAQSGIGEESFDGAAAAEWPAALSGDGLLEFIGNGGGEWEGVSSGTGETEDSSIVGSGGAAFEATNGGVGSLEFAASGGGDWPITLNGDAQLGFLAQGGLEWAAAFSGDGETALSFAGDGGLAFEFEAEGSGGAAPVVSVGGGRKLRQTIYIIDDPDPEEPAAPSVSGWGWSEWKAGQRGRGYVIGPVFEGAGRARHAARLSGEGSSVMRKVYASGGARLSHGAHGTVVADHTKVVLAEESEVALIIALS